MEIIISTILCCLAFNIFTSVLTYYWGKHRSRQELLIALQNEAKKDNSI